MGAERRFDSDERLQTLLGAPALDLADLLRIGSGLASGFVRLNDSGAAASIFSSSDLALHSYELDFTRLRIGQVQLDAAAFARSHTPAPSAAQYRPLS